jgi:hypothetical protein
MKAILYLSSYTEKKGIFTRQGKCNTMKGVLLSLTDIAEPIQPVIHFFS